MSGQETTGIKAKLDDLLRRAQAEVADVDLFAPPPPNEECPICLLPYPHGEGFKFQNCCGNLICGGCAFKHVALLGPHALGGARDICAFCRTPTPYGPGRIKAVEKLMQKQNPHAFMFMADAYKVGQDVPQNERRALEMYAQAANLGYREAYWWIAEYYKDGLVVEEDNSKCRAFLEIAAKKGSTWSHHTLAVLDERSGDAGRAINHYKVAACAGLQPSLTALMKAFKDNLLPKEELEHCLRAFQASDDEMKSLDRDDFLAWRQAEGRL